MNFTFPNHQINQHRDEAHGDESERHHQPVRSIRKQHLLHRTVVEVVRVDVKEEVLYVCVWVIAANHRGQFLQAICQAVVRSVIDIEIILKKLINLTNI